MAACYVFGMPLFKAQVVLPYFSGRPTDVAVNQYHFVDDTTATFAITASNIRDQLSTMYNAIYTGAASTRASYINWPQASVKVFRLADPTPRVPIILSMNLNEGTGPTPIPTEVACVMTWQAEPESGVRYQRLYNRVYLPGMMTAYMDVSAADQFPRFTGAFTGRIAAAAKVMADNASSSTAQWVQVSSAGGVTAVRPIAGGWVDNGPDTQRRRSVLANSRFTWDVG